MDDLLQKVPDWIQAFSLLGMCVSLLATILVRLTPTKVDDKIAGKFAKFFMQLLKWLPTLGVNPQTKALEEAYEALKKQK